MEYLWDRLAVVKKLFGGKLLSGSNMPVGDPSNVGIEIDIPTVPLKYTEEKTEDTPPNFTFYVKHSIYYAGRTNGKF